MRRLADDGDEMPPWDEVAPEIEQMRGAHVELIAFDVTTVRAARRWCDDHGYRLDHDGRVAFIRHAARLLHISDPAGSA